jgi:hypothetical protein
MDLIVDEIKTFNKDLEPIGRPYWATSKENRESQRFGSIIVAFPTQEQAQLAIKKRLYIAGISAKVAVFRNIAKTAQCSNCSGFGHLESSCKRDAKCILCAESHKLEQHKCSICKARTSCIHLVPKCTNCNSTTHSANSKACEVYLAIKDKANRVPIIINNE